MQVRVFWLPCPQVCRRVGLPLAALRVEGGRYCIMWPASPAAAARLVHPGGSHGGHLVLDVYGEGALLTQEEVWRGGRGGRGGGG
jgi:hypothetical protein